MKMIIYLPELLGEPNKMTLKNALDVLNHYMNMNVKYHLLLTIYSCPVMEWSVSKDSESLITEGIQAESGSVFGKAVVGKIPVSIVRPFEYLFIYWL